MEQLTDSGIGYVNSKIYSTPKTRAVGQINLKKNNNE